MSYRKVNIGLNASFKIYVIKATLNRSSGGRNINAGFLKILRNPKEMEGELLNLFLSEVRTCGLRRLAFQMVDANNFPRHFNRGKGMVNHKWNYGLISSTLKVHCENLNLHS
jgi:hypothetical protein